MGKGRWGTGGRDTTQCVRHDKKKKKKPKKNKNKQKKKKKKKKKKEKKKVNFKVKTYRNKSQERHNPKRGLKEDGGSKPQHKMLSVNSIP